MIATAVYVYLYILIDFFESLKDVYSAKTTPTSFALQAKVTATSELNFNRLQRML